MTAAMKRALDSVLTFVSLHGAMPSNRTLAADLNCAPTNARRLLGCLSERGELTRFDKGALALGGGGVAIIVPASIAAALAQFARTHGESVSAIAADAITLHLDQLETTEEADVPPTSAQN